MGGIVYFFIYIFILFLGGIVSQNPVCGAHSDLRASWTLCGYWGGGGLPPALGRRPHLLVQPFLAALDRGEYHLRGSFKAGVP